MKANVKKEVYRCEQLFAILDNEGQYADRYSIWYEKETRKWHYSTHNTHYAPTLLHGSVEYAQEVIDDLTSKLQKIDKDFVRTFEIVEVH